MTTDQRAARSRPSGGKLRETRHRIAKPAKRKGARIAIENDGFRRQHDTVLQRNACDAAAVRQYTLNLCSEAEPPAMGCYLLCDGMGEGAHTAFDRPNAGFLRLPDKG